jgi:hypothetical protein
MMRQGVCLIVVLSCLAIGSAQQTRGDGGRVEAVKRYWEWSSYFGVDGLEFPLVKYQPGKSFPALIFFDQIPTRNPEGWYGPAYWGFCSAEIGICHAYGGFGDGTVDQVHGTKIRKGETEEQALRRFRQTEFADDEDGPPAPPTVPIPQTPPAPSTTGSRAIDLTGITSPSPNGDQFDIRTRRGQITLPKLELPAAVRRKVSNAKAERAAREALYTPNGGCVVTVPYADERAAAIPMLVECRSGIEVTYARKGPGGDWHFSQGGLVEDKVIIDRLAPRIRSNASLVLKEAQGR